MILHKAIQREGAKGYFASANSAQGFYSLFADVYNEDKLSSLYILKGGPGTGKSTLMDKIAETASRKGFEAEVYLCSSDAGSLDGVLIKELRTAVIDGTAPHTQDPIFPGFCGEIVNLGEGWDHARLKEERYALEIMFKEKSDYYKRAYRYLSAAGIAQNDILYSVESVTDHAKADSAIRRMLRKYLGKSKSAERSSVKRFVSGYGSGGEAFLPTLLKSANNIISVSDEYGTGQIILDKIKAIGSEYGSSILTAPSPLLPEHTESVFFAEHGILFMLDRDEINTADTTKLNSKRFINNDELKNDRQKLRFSAKMKNSLLGEAKAALAEAGKVHAGIEEIYKSAMRFDKVSYMGDMLIKRIFG